MDIHRFAAALCALPLLVATPACAQLASTDDSSRLEAITWFKRLGYPSLAGKPFVRVATGESASVPNGRSVQLPRYGFLLRDRGPTFTVFFTDLTTVEYRKTPPGTEYLLEVGYQPLNLAEWSRQFSNSYLARNYQLIGEVFHGPMDSEAQGFILALACAENHHPELTEQICNANVGGTVYPNLPQNTSYKQRLCFEMAYGKMIMNMLAFEDLKISRSVLRERYAEIARRFPDSFYAEEARHFAGILAEMVREDRAHKPVSPEVLSRMSADDRAEELIYEMRDVKAQPSLFMDYDIFHDSSPAELLADARYEAVPALKA